MVGLNELTIITITYNNEYDLEKSYNSLNDFRSEGGKHIIINGGQTVAHLIKDTQLIETPDNGRYDAINKGIGFVKTKYFMLIHAGDCLVVGTMILKKQLIKMEIENLDILLNDCSIEFGSKNRLMKSSKWRPWMFKLGAQPPHPPTIYRYETFKNLKYHTEHPVIADFKYLEDVFQLRPNWNFGGYLLVHMSSGGATSSGLKSFFYVNKQFRNMKGTLKMIFFTMTRPLIKVYQML
jgi:hypothetical protein